MAETQTRDANGHAWGETFMRERFPLVCLRCLCRDDSVWADQPCDAVAEKVASRD